MAGSHKSGIDWHDPELFKNAPFIITPTIEAVTDAEEIEKSNELSNSIKKAVAELKQLVENIGARAYVISAVEHDKCTAYLSHLPHLLSSALVNLSEQKKFKSEFSDLSGGGYRDMTRIAGSSPALWQDIILSNKDNLIELISKYQEELEELKSSLENNDQNKIYNFLEKAAEIKNNINKK